MTLTVGAAIDAFLIARSNETRRPRHTWVRVMAFALAMIVVNGIITGAVRSHRVQPFRLPTSSMEPTLLFGNIVGADKRTSRLARIEKGDLLIFAYPPDPSKDLIKRCIAVGGQTIEIRNKTVYIDGSTQSEPYAKFVDPGVRPGRSDPRDNLGPVRVLPGQFSVLGDNRDNSFVSRYFGSVSGDVIRGVVTHIYWSWDPVSQAIRWERAGMDLGSANSRLTPDQRKLPR